MLGRALKRISIHSVPQPSSRKRTKAMFSDLTSEKKKNRRPPGNVPKESGAVGNLADICVNVLPGSKWRRDTDHMEHGRNRPGF